MSTSEDIRAAAERWVNGLQSTPPINRTLAEQDASILAEHILAEHRPDDEVAVTEPWADTLSRPQPTQHGTVWVLGTTQCGQVLTIRRERNSDWYLCIRGDALCRATTRGDVRRLCSALGVELEEKK